jgi:hypothetical protein
VKNAVLALLLTALLASVFLGSFVRDASAETFVGWQVYEGPYGELGQYGGAYSESDGIITFEGDDRAAGPSMYKEISPETDFEVSLDVKAETLSAVGGPLSGGSGEGFRLMINNAAVNATAGINFELRGRNGGEFWMAWHNPRCDYYGWGCDIAAFVTNASSHAVKTGVWYTMKIIAHKSPFTMTAEVYDEARSLLGSLTIDDISNFGFEGIKAVAISSLCGGTFYLRNISEHSAVSAGSTETQISIFPEVSSCTLGSPVFIKGKLTDLNGNALPNEVVVLWYTFTGLNEWLPISSGLTDDAGEYSVQWVSSASGDFSLKAGWSGNSTHLGSSNTTTLSILPYQNLTVFFVESNSSVTGLTFDSASSELRFSVTGPNGTKGFVRAVVAKSLVPDATGLIVYLDGKKVASSVASMDDSWLVAFNYSHSSHEVSIQLPSTFVQDISGTLSWAIPLLLVAIVIAAGLLVYFKKRKRLSESK